MMPLERQVSSHCTKVQCHGLEKRALGQWPCPIQPVFSNSHAHNATENEHLASVWRMKNAPYLYLLQRLQVQQEGWDREPLRIVGDYSRLCGKSKKMKVC